MSHIRLSLLPKPPKRNALHVEPRGRFLFLEWDLSILHWFSYSTNCSRKGSPGNGVGMHSAVVLCVVTFRNTEPFQQAISMLPTFAWLSESDPCHLMSHNTFRWVTVNFLCSFRPPHVGPGARARFDQVQGGQVMPEFPMWFWQPEISQKLRQWHTCRVAVWVPEPSRPSTDVGKT